MEKNNKFTKSERLSRKAVIDRLYAEGRSVAAFPLRAVYLPLEPEEGEPTVSILIAVSSFPIALALSTHSLNPSS